MTITIYSKPVGCFGCTKTKELFDKAGVSYVDVDITDPANEAALSYVTEELGYSQAPIVVVEIDGTINAWSGLQPGKIEKAVEIETAAA